MITLYGFGPGFGLPEISPFVTKTEVQLKMAGLAYGKTRPMVVSTRTRSEGPGQPDPSCHRLAGPTAWISSSMATGRFLWLHLPFAFRAAMPRMVRW